MSHPMSRVAPLSVLVGAALLSACGGGDGGPVDPRSGNYTALAANGERFTLDMDFDAGRARFQRAAAGSPVEEGGFSADAVAGTYLFQSQAGAGKTARFRYLDDLVVGNYNFNGSVRPFVAARRFAQTAAEAAGDYNTLGVSQTAAGAGDSVVYALRIGADATLQTCVDTTVYAIAKCPAASLRNHALSVAGDAFTATPVPASAGAAFNFRIARAGSEKVFLMADVAANGTQAFRIGVAESSTFRTGFDWGGTTAGAWARADYNAGNYSSEGVMPDGSPTSYGGSLAALGADGPQGIRSFEFGNAFVVQNTQLTVVLGTVKGKSAGFMQVGVR